jgi:hypothetical protein
MDKAEELIALAERVDVETIAQWLHDEGGFDEAWSDSATWPEHPEDTGQRDGGYVRLVPSDVQAKFRDVARRLLMRFPRAGIPEQGAALNYVADMTCIGTDCEWHFKPGYDPQVVLDALAQKETGK